jgi:LuxR family maltose regulon positive regulatory protein
LAAQANGVIDGNPLANEFMDMYCLIARFLLVNGNLKEAKALIEKLLELAEIAGLVGTKVELLAMQALVLAGFPDQAPKKERLDAAMVSLQESLGLAVSERYVRTFVELGTPMFDLISQALTRNIEPVYVKKLLNEFEKEIHQAIQVPPMSMEQNSTVSPLFEPISGRERDVLKLLSQGYSDKRIAEILVISPGTIHTHLKNIYGKLDVHSRTEAIARARELNLL